MKETDYIYAVARIRAVEAALLTQADISRLISAPDMTSAERVLTDKGWEIPDSGQSFNIAERELEKAITLIRESVPGSPLADALIIGNDFFNLKAAIKCAFSDEDPDGYYVHPCVTDTALITKAIAERDFSALPEHLADCAEKAHTAVAKHESGQLAESIIDKAGLEARLRFAKASESGILEEICLLNCAAANIKIALRCTAMGKSREFALDSMCSCTTDNNALLDNAFSAEALAAYIETTEFAYLAPGIRQSFTAFEKLCDNTVVSLIRKAKYEIYGADPVTAYYYAKKAETDNVRIILSAKAGGVPAEAISERVRDMYV